MGSRPTYLRAAVICALGTCAPALGAARTVVPGVTYERLATGGQVTHVVRVTPGPLVSLRPARGGAAVANRAPLTTIMSRLRPSGALVGVNGDFFNFQGGYPSGMLMIGGELMHEPEPSRSALGILASGSLVPVRSELSGEWTSSLAPDPSVPFGFRGLNRLAEGNETVLYTPRYGGPTPVGRDRVDAMIRLDALAALRPNRELNGTVVAQRAKGGLVPSGRSFVLSGVGGGLADRVAAYLKPGARVTLRAAVSGLTGDVRHALGGGPLLVDGGAAVHGAGEGFTYGQINARTARTAVGQTASGRLLFVVAEGPAEGSRGLTVDQQADLMASLGARTAVAMDGGGSASMVVAGRLVNRPAAGPRALANALVLRYAGVQLTNPAAVLTPNGDASREATRTLAWAAKRGRAVVTLARPDGARVRTLYNGIIGPTPRPIAIRGRAVAVRDGRYRVYARFRPLDGTRGSVQARPLTIDRTLGHLALAKTGRPPRLRVRFRLVRHATVTMVVTNARGRTVSVLMRRHALPRGARLHTWDMLRSGRRLPPGVYRVSIWTRGDRADRLSARFRVGA